MLYKLLPKAEQEYAARIFINLFRMSALVDQFRSAVALADFCSATFPSSLLHIKSDEDRAKYERFRDWKMLAVRDAAVTLGNYVEARKAIEKDCDKCPTVLAYIDQGALAKHENIFEVAFPNVSGVRTSVAHSARLIRSERERERHVRRGEELPGMKVQGGRELLMSGLSGNTYSATHEGGGSFSLDGSGVDALEAATSEYYRAYEPVAEFTRALRSKLLQ